MQSDAVKENIRLRNNKIAEAVADNNDRTLWNEVRKITRTNTNLPNAIDGLNDVEDITNIIYRKYDYLYNSVGYNEHDMKLLYDAIDSRIKYDFQYNDNTPIRKITVSEIFPILRVLS